MTKENIIWIIVWLLCVYINGGEVALATKPISLVHYIEPILWGTLIFVVIYFAWRKAYQPKFNSGENKNLSKRTSLVLLIIPIVVLCLYFLGKIDFILFFVFAVAWLIVTKYLISRKT